MSIRILPFLLILTASVIRADVGEPVSSPYRDGDVVVFFGDSITHGGLYHSYMTDFYRTRFPEAKIRFVNSGIGGDTAHEALSRIPEDVLEYQPTHVTFHFGMNDINRGAYLPRSSPESLMAREAAQANYRQTLPRLINAVRRAVPTAKFTYLTPTHYDDTAIITNAPPNWSGWASINNVGCNVGLSLMAGFVISRARADGVPYVDWYSCLNNFLTQRRTTDAHYMLTRIDRVHPEAVGHSFMAWEFLRRQGVDPIVSAVTVDATSARVLESKNAALNLVRASPRGASFGLLARALPFPVPHAALPYVGEFKVEETLNLEMVRVTGLSSGVYALKIDGTIVGSYDATAFARGIRLGFNEKTPQYRQAQLVLARVEELRLREAKLRNHHSARWFYGRLGAPVDDVKAFAAWFEKNEKNKDAYFAKFVPGYLAYWPTYRETREKLFADQLAVCALAKPILHTYEIIPEADLK